MTAADEHDEKLDRVARIAHAAGLAGVLLAGHHNIAWLTSGRGNRIDASREIGTARLLIAADGRRFVLANAIEMPRLAGEELTGLDYTPVEYPWTEEQANPGTPIAIAKLAVLGRDVGSRNWNSRRRSFRMPSDCYLSR